MFFVFEGYGDHRDLNVLTHSFPTRRSSDLGMVGDGADDAEPDVRERADGEAHPFGREARDERGVFEAAVAMVDAVDLQHVERFADVFGRAFLACVRDEFEPEARSEEHTSELQSLMRISYAVFCLKTKTNT